MKVNRNIAIEIFKDKLIHFVLDEDHNKQTSLYDDMCQAVGKNLVPIRKDEISPEPDQDFQSSIPLTENAASKA